VRVIGQSWKDMVWDDVLSLHPGLGTRPPFKELERQFHDLAFEPDEPWRTLRADYFRLSRFYNAVGFADSITHAIDAVSANPELVDHTLWIIDEFQDFNTAEDALLKSCTDAADGVLLAGDDDQALYQQLKASHPEIIRSYYADTTWTNAMLPFCSRCSYHIAMGAAAFIAAKRSSESIHKLYLPLKIDEDAAMIRVAACTTPATAVDYIEAFINEHHAEIEARREAIVAGEAKDPFLLILSPLRDVRRCYTKKQGDRLLGIVEEWRLEAAGPGADYYRLLTYHRLSIRTDR
jgi:superfamily I DNA/RNA helicase